MEFRELARINGGYAEARILQAAVTLGLFDQLDAAGRSAATVAGAAGTDARATELLLNALVAMRIVRKDGDLFQDTEVARTYLTSASPTSYAGFVRFDASLWPLWGNLVETVRTGKPARDPDMFQSSAEDTARFIDAMESIVQARGDARVLADTLDLGGVRRLLDVGAGPGTYAIELCRRHPELRATIFDLPGALASPAATSTRAASATASSSSPATTCATRCRRVTTSCSSPTSSTARTQTPTAPSCARSTGRSRPAAAC
jgi:hypothetical protein